MNDSIHDLVSFVAFTHEIRNVKRAMWNVGEEVYENDSEHGYQLAMVALYIIEQQNLGLDAYKAMALAMVHDILEVHAGDTPVFGSQTAIASKRAREEEAVVKLRQQWPKLTLMHELIQECEARTSPESKFIYALDKLVPMLNNYLDHGRNWIRQAATFDHMVAIKEGKVDIDPVVKAYYDQTLELLKARPEFFAQSQK